METSKVVTAETMEQVAAKGEDFRLSDFRKAGEASPHVAFAAAHANEPVGSVVVELERAIPEVPPVETPESVTERTRDEKGRFASTKEPGSTQQAETETVVPKEEKERPPQTVSEFEKRLAKERARRGELERRLEQLERDRQTPPAPTKPELVAAAPPRSTQTAFPSFEAFQKDHPEASYEDYIDARAEAKAEAKVEAKLLAERARLDAESANHAIENALRQIQHQGPQRHADYEAVQEAAFNEGMKWAPHISEFVLRHTESVEEAIDLTYTLLKEAQLVDRLNSLPPGRAFYELGKLTVSSKASAAAPSGSVAPVPPVTRAPAPPQPVGGGHTASPSMESLVAGTEISLKRIRAAKAARGEA